MALVVLLRGVNVGGHRRFRPSVLAQQLGHLDAVNVGAAGTLVIRRPVSQSQLRAEVARRLPFDAHIVICPARDLVELMARDAFADYTIRPGMTRFVSVLPRSPRSAPALPLSFPSSGRWLVRIISQHARFVLGLYRRHMKVITYLGALDRVFGTPVTTRNWNTISAIASVLDGRGRAGG